MNRSGYRRAAVIALAALMATSLMAPAATARPDPCTWQVTPIDAPDGFEAEFITIAGTDSNGNYSGNMRGTGQETDFILWSHGKAERQPQPPGIGFIRAVDENAAGTVLLRASTFDFRDSLVFTYSGGHTGNGVYQTLPVPPGYMRPEPRAINDRGDVVGSARRVADGRQVALFWPVLGAGPVVIDPPQLIAPGGSDIDEDGTILLTDGYEAFLWRGGELIRFPTPQPPVLGRGLRGGKAVGIDLAGPRGVLWNTPMDVGFPEGSGTAEAINKHGLIAGSLDTWNGPAAAWQDTRLLGQLPLPPGATSASATVVGDDGTIFGYANPAVGPVRWQCAGVE